ncbi:MAG: PorP/SprF family type IX secretion system membrane protein [Bacteroidetes bacterium]|nr:PorP/SprF family type IX secretion system membrane protein [Bacteroidota bacterium]
MVQLRYAFLLATTLISLGFNAQQDKIITHFIYDKMSLNPGETGIDEGICGTSIYRNQWDKVTGAPVSMVFNVEANINRYFPGGVGLSFFHDRIGFAKQNNVLLNYAYPVYTDYGTLQVGLGAGLFNFGINPDWIPPTNDFDPSLPVGFKANSLDVNFGVYFKGLENYYVGISTTHANAPRLSQTVDLGTAKFEQTYNSARHYYIMGGYTTDPLGPGVINGNFLFRTDAVKSSMDFNARYILPIGPLDAYGGLTYRTNDAIAIMIGGSKNNFTVGYSYDLTVNKLSTVSRGSHEILLKYCYYLPPLKKTPSKHPRWL